MNTKKLINTVTIITFIFGATVLSKEVSAAQANNGEKMLEQISKEGREAAREMKWSRVAMFDGNIDQASKLLTKAKENLAKVEKQEPQLVVTVNTEEKLGGKTIGQQKSTMTNDLIPIDAGLSLAEDYVATPEKNEKIKQANEHLKKKETSKAVEVLREADIGVSVSRVLMPVKDTIKHVDKAIELVGEHKYYEANLALKAAEDGLIVDSVLLYQPTAATGS
ncbi:YfdX family protein [Methylomarinum vadi]|uniref:YfdX family protein n=1 Tax=Methylomarinum vadi TaxID=438855 RepID=UPI0004DF793D|nr:YfdX family protein [Methylomarinum vadi]